MRHECDIYLHRTINYITVVIYRERWTTAEESVRNTPWIQHPRPWRLKIIYMAKLFAVEDNVVEIRLYTSDAVILTVSLTELILLNRLQKNL